MAIGSLGEPCVEHHAIFIYDRGATRRIAQINDVTTVQWGRSRDDMSEGRFEVAGQSCSAQAPLLASLEPRRHELVIYRGDYRVWEGPIVQISWFYDHVEVLAHDVCEYLAGTALSKQWPDPAIDGGPQVYPERLGQIISYELTTPYDMETNQGTVIVPRWENIATPANILPFLVIHPGEVLTTAHTEAFEMTVLERLNNGAQGGTDYCAVGRSLHIWDTAYAIGQTRVVTETDFLGTPQVTALGSQHASIGHISATTREDVTDVGGDDGTGDGGDGGDNGTGTDPSTPPGEGANQAGVGNAGAENDYYGVWTTIATLDSETGDPTQTYLNTQAQRNLTGKTPVPLEVRMPSGVSMRLSRGLEINDLVPGVAVPLRATFGMRPISQLQRLDKVTVTETPAREDVKVTLTPAGDALAIHAQDEQARAIISAAGGQAGLEPSEHIPLRFGELTP